jgi:acyl-coenzyme A thioesterase PaaI-like protein
MTSGDAAAIKAVNETIPYARAIGLEAAIDEYGLLTVLRFQPNNIGNAILRAIHGGVVGAVLEHAAILHLLYEAKPATIPKIVNLSVDFLRPSLATDIFARGRIVKQGQRIANVRVEAWQKDPSRPVAAAHAHFLVSMGKLNKPS